MARSFFAAGGSDPLYMAIRDDPVHAEARVRCEKLWQRFAPYCADQEHFLSEAQRQFHARVWEVIVAWVLLEHGFALERPPPNGPDIVIAGSQGRTCIEATTVGLGSGEDHAGAIEEPIDEHSSYLYFQQDKTILRYTGKVDAKTKQLQDFRARSVIAPDDRYVIALNGALLSDHSEDDDDPTILKALYPLDDPVALIVPGSDQPPTVRYPYRGHVEKASGEPIKTTWFDSDACLGVSALLFSRTTICDPLPRYAARMRLIHNRRATVRLPPSFFPFGREALVDDQGWTWQTHPEDDRS